MRFPARVELADITIRDGFQHEEKWIPTQAKLWIAEELILAGYRRVEVTNLGNPKAMPQFADADEVLKGIRTSKRLAAVIEDVELTAITIRERAVDRAIALRQAGQGPDRILMMVSTSASHMKKNSGLDHAGYWAEAYQAMDYRHGPIAIAAPRRAVWAFGDIPTASLNRRSSCRALNPNRAPSSLRRIAPPAWGSRGLRSRDRFAWDGLSRRSGIGSRSLRRPRRTR